MKTLQVTADIEKLLIQIFDAALKSSGFSMYGAIQQVIGSISAQPPIVAEQPVQE